MCQVLADVGGKVLRRDLRTDRMQHLYMSSQYSVKLRDVHSKASAYTPPASPTHLTLHGCSLSHSPLKVIQTQRTVLWERRVEHDLEVPRHKDHNRHTDASVESRTAAVPM